MDRFMNWLRCCLFLGLALFAVAARTQDPVPEETILRRQHVVLPVLESRSSDIPLAAAYQALSDRAFMAAVRAYRAELAAYLREEAPVIDLGDGGDVFYDSVLMEDDIFLARYAKDVDADIVTYGQVLVAPGEDLFDIVFTSFDARLGARFSYSIPMHEVIIRADEGEVLEGVYTQLLFESLNENASLSTDYGPRERADGNGGAPE
jgi:hypothetical protein